MPKQVLAVALCRVSSVEQLQNNSMGNQKNIVQKTAEMLGAILPKDGVWEGAISSKKGVNFDRKDLKEIYEYCKNNPAVQYLIVQEVDRFMRSPDEQTYWYVKFWYELKVRVWFADKPELNVDTHEASLLRYLDGWRAGGSNVERINKSINGQTAALKEGRYPFAPKPGYKRGSKIGSGIQDIDPVRGPALRAILIRIAARLVTPSQGLIELNKSDFATGCSEYRMDKFRKMLIDPFYAGIVEVDKQVKVRNENGLHEPLITKEQHYQLLSIMDKKKKNQSGPRKGGNPHYPLSNLVSCKRCENSSIGRIVGFKHTNGKHQKIYEKYRCRACRKYQKRNELHEKIETKFNDNPITPEGRDDFLEALNIIWKQQEGQAEQETNRIKHKIKSLGEKKNRQIESLAEPQNNFIQDEIREHIINIKAEIVNLENQLEELTSGADDNKKRFLRFAFNFVDNMGSNFLDINLVSKENRLRCKQLVFPAGFWLDENDKVYTPEISPLITLQTKKKDAEASNLADVVRVKRL